jgi:hypothetical protein
MSQYGHNIALNMSITVIIKINIMITINVSWRVVLLDHEQSPFLEMSILTPDATNDGWSLHVKA